MNDQQSFGQALRNIRMKYHWSMRMLWQHCEKMDATYLSAYERDLKQISEDEVYQIIGALSSVGLTQKESDLLLELSKIQIKEKQYNTEEEVIHMLPIFTHGTNGNRLTKDQIQVLIDSLKKNW